MLLEWLMEHRGCSSCAGCWFASKSKILVITFKAFHGMEPWHGMESEELSWPQWDWPSPFSLADGACYQSRSFSWWGPGEEPLLLWGLFFGTSFSQRWCQPCPIWPSRRGLKSGSAGLGVLMRILCIGGCSWTNREDATMSFLFLLDFFFLPNPVHIVIFMIL